MKTTSLRIEFQDLLGHRKHLKRFQKGNKCFFALVLCAILFRFIHKYITFYYFLLIHQLFLSFYCIYYVGFMG